MNAAIERLMSALPQRHVPGKDAFASEPRALKAWIDALPLANASATARLLYQGLRDLNALKIDPLQRLNALEALRGPVSQIAETVDRQIIGSSFPLPPQKQQLGGIAQDFQRELSTGYRIAALELCGGAEAKVPFMRGKAVAVALQRAISHCGAQLAKAYLIYATPAAGLWQTLHDLYRYAELARVDDKAVEDPLLGDAEMSPRHSYLHALLLAISNPYRLAQREIFDSYHATRVWSLQCRLVQGAATAGGYSIPLDEDRGPGYLPEERRGAGANVLSFDTQALEADLERQLARLSGMEGPVSFRLKGGPGAALAVELIRRLMKSWEPASTRALPRLPGGHTLHTLIGLTAVHFELAGGMDFESFVRRSRGSVVTLSERDRDRAASWAVQPGDGGRPEIYPARVLDQGLGGYRIEWEQVESVRARVGEVVGLSLVGTSAEPQDWMVGVIRWMRIDVQGRVDAGIELLAREAYAAALRAIDAQGKSKPPIRAVRLAPLDDAEDPAGYTLIAPSVLERHAAHFELVCTPDLYGAVDEDSISLDLASVALIEQVGTNVRLSQTPLVATSVEA